MKKTDKLKEEMEKLKMKFNFKQAVKFGLIFPLMFIGFLILISLTIFLDFRVIFYLKEMWIRVLIVISIFAFIIGGVV